VKLVICSNCNGWLGYFHTRQHWNYDPLTAIWSCLLSPASVGLPTAFPALLTYRFPSDSNKHEFCCLAFQHKNRQSCCCSCGRRAINMYLLLGTLYHFTPVHFLVAKWNFPHSEFLIIIPVTCRVRGYTVFVQNIVTGRK